MRREGKLDLIGLSNAATDTVRRALELVDIACVQNAFSVVNRADEDELAFCEEHDIAFVPFFPLGSAFTGGPKQLAADPAVAEVAEKHGATPSQIALAWLLHRSDRILLIPGTSTPAPPRGEHGRRRDRARRAGHGTAGRGRGSRRPASGLTRWGRSRWTAPYLPHTVVAPRSYQPPPGPPPLAPPCGPPPQLWMSQG